MKMWLFLVLLSLCLPPSLSQVSSLVQVLANEGDTICLKGCLQYICTVYSFVYGTKLIWKYSGGETQAAQHFLPTDTAAINQDFQLGPFNVVLSNITFYNMSTCVLTSTASVDDGLTADIDGKSISCTSKSFSQSRTISFTVPKITNVSFCMSTISWSPPSCDTNCIVSVDGQEIDTVPCKNGKLQTHHSDLSNKEVTIISTDSSGNVRNTSTMFILEDCSGFPISTTTVKSTGSPSAFVRGGLSAGEIVGIAIAVFVPYTVALTTAVTLIFWFRLQKNGGKWKKKAIDDSDSATSSLDDYKNDPAIDDIKQEEEDDHKNDPAIDDIKQEEEGEKWKKKATNDSDSATSSLGKIQWRKCIPVVSTYIPTVALYIVVAIFVYTSFHYHESYSDFGLELCDETVLKVTGPGPHNITWEDYGFHLIVPHGAVLEDVTVDVTVKSFLPVGGKFNLPENFHLVSAIYEVSSSENFKENVSIQIQHYAIISSDEDTADYAFVKGRHSGTNDHYTFEILNGAFSPHSQLATISLNHFCKLGSVANSTRPTKTYRYAAHAYQRHNPAQPTKLELEFLLTPRETIYEKILNDEYTGWNKSVKAFDIAFEGDSITLDINTNTKVEPHTPLQIEKGYIDDLCEGESEIIPSSKVLVGLKEEQPMSFNVNLLGAKPPRNFFTVSAPPRPFESSKGHGESAWYWIPPVCLFILILLLRIIQFCGKPFPSKFVDTSFAVLILVLYIMIARMIEDKYSQFVLYLLGLVLEVLIASANQQFPKSQATLKQVKNFLRNPFFR